MYVASQERLIEPHYPRRVLLVISNLEYGGAQRQVVELANGMQASRFDVHVCSFSDYVPLGAGLSERERRLHIVRKTFKFDGSVVFRLARLLRRLNVDVVHSYLFDADIAVRLAGRLAGTALVVNSERNTDYYLKPRQLMAYHLTRGCVDLILANSNAGAAFNSRMLGHPRSRYRVVHNGVDTGRFTPQPAAPIRRELGIADDARVVGMFASFKGQKNHPLIFAAARRICQCAPEVLFMFVGDELYGGMHGSDEYKRRMELLVRESGIRDRCLFLGNRSDVERLYCACDITVLPSLFEGTPNVALESMACGVPVVATDVSDNAYVIPDGRVGYVVPLGEESILAERICSLLADPQTRTAAGREARRWVEQEFATSRMVEKTAIVYEEWLCHKSVNDRPRRIQAALRAGE